ncbi:MAG: hypothetical protein F6K30_23990, partial [Cyanothece sp. SIO2G6]|nr:hypothetical protein [Cyanothece sp. SIO2G6]
MPTQWALYLNFRTTLMGLKSTPVSPKNLFLAQQFIDPNPTHHRGYFQPNTQLMAIALPLLPSTVCLLPSAFCLLPSTFCLLPSAFCLLPSAFCLLPSAFYRLPFLTFFVNTAITSFGWP